MNSIHTTQLTAAQKAEILDLVSACKAIEPLSLSAPLEDGLDYFLLYENQQLVSLLFLFLPEETICECGAFTLPLWRKQGFFSSLLDDALTFLEEKDSNPDTPLDFCFLTDEHTPSSTSVLKEIGAEFWYSEYKMDYPCSLADHNYSASLLIEEVEEHIYTASKNGEIIGTCIILPSGQDAYFYGFEIKEPLRGRGYGYDFLQGMLVLLSDTGFHTISLQVSGQNQPALSLYKKTGFQITETLSYYMY